MSSLRTENLSVLSEAMDSYRGIENRIRTEEPGSGSVRQKDEAGIPNEGATFSDLLKKSVDQANDYQKQADHAIKELVAGRTKNIHETMLAIERADLSLKLLVQVRNKVVDAYREIMRMQV